jgi:hypothetical protein
MNDSEWSTFCESVLEVQRSDFMKEMEDRLRTLGSKSSMGIFDSAVLMALARTSISTWNFGISGKNLSERAS